MTISAGWRVVRGLLLGAAFAWSSACSGNPVAVRAVSTADGLAAHRRTAIDGELSLASRSLLHRTGRTALASESPTALVAAFGDSAALDAANALLLAELLLLATTRATPAEAAACRLEAALAAYRVVATAPAGRLFDPTVQTAAELYDFALAELLSTPSTQAALLRGGRLAGLGRTFVLERHGGADDWPVDFFDAIQPAATMTMTGLRSHHVRSGLGLPLVAVRRQGTERRPVEPFYPPESRSYPATLLVVPSGADRLAVRLLDPTRTSSVAMLRGDVPIAADFTMPYAALLAGARLHDLADRGFFRPEWDAGRNGMFLMEPYAPDKTPVVLIHGLWSSPMVWRDMTNELWGDREVASRYQVWHYLYPTGAPILNNVRDLRLALAAARAHFDPEGDDFASRDVVLVGHSMGGVIAKTLLQASGDALWSARFDVPFAAMADQLSADARDYAEQTFFHVPLPYVHRAIFVGAPHRGSADADSMVGRFGSWLQTRPKRVVEFADEVERVAPGAMRRDTLATPGSVDLLSPGHVVLRTLAELPIRSGVAYHTIAGNVAAPGEEPTDGVVEVRSAHLDGAASELVLPGAGHDLQQDPRAIAEVLRILREHRVLAPRGDG